MLVVCPLSLYGQAPSVASCATYPGDKYVFSGSGTQISAHDYIDASQLIGSGSTDVCAAISAGLTNLANGNTSSTTCGTPAYLDNGVIDARGVPSTNGTFACASSPFLDPPTYSELNVTVLLPAGIIPIKSTWYLPSNTRLIGEGSYNSATVNGGNTNIYSVTEIQAAGSSWASTTPMIYMGDASGTICGGGTSPNCHGISIEHLGLDGASNALIGISNSYAQELNYVNDVALTNIAGTGMSIAGSANNSGPYTNIYFWGTGTCLNINGTLNTRGVNGLHCYYTGASTSTAPTAIQLDASNNLIQNVYITDYYKATDGIEIGQNATATNNVLLNISGSTGSSGVTNLVDIYATYTPTDLTFMGISGGKTNAINDQVTNSKIATGTVGLYVLGEALTGTSGYSRFSTATSSTVPAWVQGTFVPSSVSPWTSCLTVDGTLYSVTPTSAATSTASPTLWACIGTSSPYWYPLSTD